MNSFEIGNLIYLVLLLVMVLIWFVAQNRQSLGKMVQQALAWGLIFVGVIAAIVLIQHRANIGRLMRGEEPKVGQKS